MVPVLSVVVDAECFSAFRTDPNGMAWNLTILAIFHGTPIRVSSIGRPSIIFSGTHLNTGSTTAQKPPSLALSADAAWNLEGPETSAPLNQLQKSHVSI